MKAIPKRTLLVTCVVILLPMFFGLALWNRLPERMPTHFDFSGTADDYSGRPFAVICIPLFILAMQLFCAVMLRADPKKQNISEKMAQLVLWVCPAVSLFAGLSMYLSALGFAINELGLYLDTHRDDEEATALYTSMLSAMRTRFSSISRVVVI